MKKFDFHEPFQRKIIALMVQDPTFLPRMSSVLNPMWFESPPLQAIVRSILDIFKQTSSRPSQEVLIEHFANYCRNFAVPPADRQLGVLIIGEVFSINLDDGSFVVEQVVAFSKHQALLHAGHQIADLLETGTMRDYPKAREILDKALSVGEMTSNGMDFHEAIRNLSEIIATSSYSPTKKTPIGFPAIDAALGGGVGVGELLVAIAGPKYGKSMLLLNMAYAALIAGKSVVYFTLELKKDDVLFRMLQRMCHISQTDVIYNHEAHRDKINRKAGAIGINRFHISYFSPGTADVSTFRSYLYLLGTRGFNPDVIIVDYADKMKLTNPKDRYMELGHIYDELIHLGDDLGSAVYTASQTNRDSYDNDQVGVGSIADSWQKIAGCDIALMLQRTTQSVIGGYEYSLELALNRRGISGVKVPLLMNYDKATIKPRPIDRRVG